MPLDPNILLQSQVPQNQNPLEQYSRVLALKNALGQGQLQQQQIQEGQIALRGQQALDSAYKNAFSKDADGNLTLNKDAVVNGLTQAGAGHLVPGVLKGFTEMDSAAADLKKKQTDAKTAADDYLASSLLTITDNKYDPKVAIGAIAHGAATGAIPQQQATQLAGQITANPTPDTVKGLIDPLLSQSPAYQKLIDSRKTAQGSADRGAAATQQAATSAGKETREAGQQQFQNAISDLAANPPKTALEYRQRISALPTEQAMRIMEAAPIGQYDPATTPAMLRKIGMKPEEQTQADQAATNAAETKDYHNKRLAQTAGEDSALNLTPEGLDVAAKMFAKTGTLPPMGMGKAGASVRTKIINRASEIGGKDLDIADAKAAYGANTDSLKKLQTQFDGVTAFESTAGKNLDTFLKTAEKVVDSGSPWINKPLRGVSGSGLGSAEQAAFNAARVTAVTEIGKVLNSANATGVLSDSARHEVDALMGPNASLKQIYSAASILRQDMKNRHDSYAEQIDAIKKRIGSLNSAGPSQATGQPKATHRYNPATGQIEAVK